MTPAVRRRELPPCAGACCSSGGERMRSCKALPAKGGASDRATVRNAPDIIASNAHPTLGTTATTHIRVVPGGAATFRAVRNAALAGLSMRHNTDLRGRL